MARFNTLLPGLLTVVTVMGCGDKSGDSADASGGLDCARPIAEAGDSQALPLGARVTLNGSESSWCESFSSDDVNYVWSFQSVPASSEVGDEALSENRTAAAMHPDFVPDVPGEYTLSLRVNDPTNASEPDWVVVTISSDDIAPLADCGPDLEGEVGLASTLDATASSDPEGAEISYTWAVSSTPDCSGLSSSSLFDQGSTAASLIPDCPGLFVVSLVVSDGLHWSEPDYCTIDVVADNRQPIADAGPGGSVPACADNPFQLNGHGSYDIDGDALTYAWSVVSTPPGADATLYSFSDATEVSPYFTWNVPGEWSFRLQTHDGTVASAPDVVTYLVTDSSENSSPTANAGGDLTVEVIGNCEVSTGYTYICEDCPATMVELDGSGSSDPDGDTLTFTWSELTDTLSFSSTSLALVQVELPAMTSEYEEDNTVTYDLQLDVADCSLDDEDRIVLTHICTGDLDSSSPW
jgi:hypothetical protein